MASTRSGTRYNCSRSSQKCNGHDYGRSQSVTEEQGGHLKSQLGGLQQCIEAQGVPDPGSSVEKLHQFLPDCEKIPGPSQHFQVAQWMASIDGKEEHDSLNSIMEEKPPPPPKQVSKTAPVSSSSNSNMKKQPQAWNKVKGKAPATNPYSQGYRIPYKMYFIELYEAITNIKSHIYDKNSSIGKNLKNITSV
ncbi:hypothetical protein O181_108257 [Austropuccinia psidii MF-1]|uniref:Uncharacterized protein n=1 Tax=Austropuccinia psidii MF-1 TaxID=1389203 RepID=A0A9Q3JTV3_9BASI|nr:hypothetical protein [Austropuccinia psidii MF-1]